MRGGEIAANRPPSSERRDRDESEATEKSRAEDVCNISDCPQWCDTSFVSLASYCLPMVYDCKVLVEGWVEDAKFY